MSKRRRPAKLKAMTPLRCLRALKALIDFRARPPEERQVYRLDEVVEMLDEAVRAGLHRRRR